MKKIACLWLTVLLILTACGSNDGGNTLSWQEQYDLGVRYLSEGNYEEAIIAFTAAIEINPKQAEAYIGLADVYIAQGNEEKAAEILNQAMKDVSEIEALADVLKHLGERIQHASAPEEQVHADVPQSVEGYPKEERYDMDNGMYSIVSYDQFGKTIKKNIYNADGTVQSSDQREYDANGKLLYDVSQQYGEFDFVTTRHYDSTQRLERLERIIVDNINQEYNYSRTETYIYSYQDQTVEIYASELYQNGVSFECGMTYTMESGVIYVEAAIATRLEHDSNGIHAVSAWIANIHEYTEPFKSIGTVEYDENGEIKSEEKMRN